VFQSGFTCNSGVIPILVGEGDAILSDELNHASIIDGIRLTRSQRKIWRHADMNALEFALQETQGQTPARDHGRRVQHGR
jgi:glycine C-acetyltransferase